MLKFSQFYLLGFFFSNPISYELYLKLIQYQLKVQLFSIYPKDLSSKPTVLQAMSWMCLFKMQRQSTMVSKAL